MRSAPRGVLLLPAGRLWSLAATLYTDPRRVKAVLCTVGLQLLQFSTSCHEAGLYPFEGVCFPENSDFVPYNVLAPTAVVRL